MIKVRQRLPSWLKETHVAVCKRWDINHVVHGHVTYFVDSTFYLITFLLLTLDDHETGGVDIFSI